MDKETEKEFDKKFAGLYEEALNVKGAFEPMVIQKAVRIDVKAFISKIEAKAHQEGRREALGETKTKLERLKLEFDVIVCDCGEPYKDSDPADFVNEWLQSLTKTQDK